MKYILSSLLFLTVIGCNNVSKDVQITAHYNSDEIARVRAKLDNTKPDEFSFVVMGDNRNGDDIFKQFIEEINKIEPTPLFIIDSGDLVPAGKNHQYRNFLDMISKCKLPFLCLPGNHDYYNNGKELYIKYFGVPYYYFDIWDFRFILLDNADVLDSEQINWLSKLLADGKKCFIFMHKPPPLDKWALHSFKENADEFLKLIKQENNIMACFFGHIHGYSEKEYNGVKLFISAGAGSPFNPLYASAVEFVYNYMIVNVKKDGSWSYRVRKKGK